MAMLQQGLKLSARCFGSGTSKELQAKVKCHLMFFMGPPSVSYKVTCRWLLFVLDLEVLSPGQAAKQGQLLPVQSLGPLRERERTS